MAAYYFDARAHEVGEDHGDEPYALMTATLPGEPANHHSIALRWIESGQRPVDAYASDSYKSPGTGTTRSRMRSRTARPPVATPGDREAPPNFQAEELRSRSSALRVAGIAAARVGVPVPDGAVPLLDDVFNIPRDCHIAASGLRVGLGLVRAAGAVVALGPVLPHAVLVVRLDVASSHGASTPCWPQVGRVPDTAPG